MMVRKRLLEEEKIEETVRAVAGDSFTVLDFIATFKEKHPMEWKKLVRDLGNLGAREDTRSPHIFRTD